ncbi:MAG: nicotinate phosphoribosyltransferase [Verrucomicrobia bacterium]|nr:MAG: nicotinate phosphoribosyltransferase [Verrucomicrobiota bacterium]
MICQQSSISMEAERHSLLLNDLYELTMGFGYWKNQMHEREALFHLFFRKNPFEGSYSVACGLGDAIEYLQNLHLSDRECDYLAGLIGRDKRPLFEKGFLTYLKKMRFSCDVDAVPEGTIVFPHEPILRVRGPLLQAQLIEPVLLNIIDFQTLIATKSSRIRTAAGGDPVIEFGLRRAQGIDGALSASRAAYVGGCTGTSNVLAGMRYGLPVFGTHAHSWVMAFDDEKKSFEAYAQAQPNNCIFLVDTYDTLKGVRNAVEIAKKLRQQGHQALGIRLDSGDLAYLSAEARKILDEAGLPEMAIVATNELDEHIITSLKNQGAQVNMWGIGTKLVTAYDQPALGGVYKLAALKQEDGHWSPRLKLSEQLLKVSTPGRLQVRRFELDGQFIGDMIYDELSPERDDSILRHPTDVTRTKRIPESATAKDLLVSVFQRGRKIYPDVSLQEIQQRAAAQFKEFHPSIQRLLNPHEYPVGMESNLYRIKTNLILKLRESITSSTPVCL